MYHLDFILKVQVHLDVSRNQTVRYHEILDTYIIYLQYIYIYTHKNAENGRKKHMLNLRFLLGIYQFSLESLKEATSFVGLSALVMDKSWTPPELIIVGVGDGCQVIHSICGEILLLNSSKRIHFRVYSGCCILWNWYIYIERESQFYLSNMKFCHFSDAGQLYHKVWILVNFDRAFHDWPISRLMFWTCSIFQMPSNPEVFFNK